MSHELLPAGAGQRHWTTPALCGLALLWSVSTQVAASVHVGAGLADRIEGEGVGILSVSWVGAERHPWVFMLGHLGERQSLDDGPIDDTWFVSASKRIRWKSWFMQGGIAWSGPDTEVLSRYFQFQTAAGWRHGPWTLSLQHLSNANTGGRNRGESYLLVEYAL